MRIIISLLALFLSIILVQLSSGVIGPLDVFSARELGFSTTATGLLGSAHFTGFLFGSWWAPRVMASVGHSRSFAAFAALGAIGAIGHTLSNDPWVWTFLRTLTGLSMAGSFTVIEAWMNAKVSNTYRGRVFGVYRVVDISASLVAVLMLSYLPPANFVSYNILAILCCAAIFPLTLTKSLPPTTTKVARLRPMASYRISPLATVGVVVAGLGFGAFRMAGPIFAQESGLDQSQTALFLAAVLLGGALAQIPVGWFADRYPRRRVLSVLSLLAAIASVGVVAASAYGATATIAASFVFGLFAYPVYSVSAALANDFADRDTMIELAAGLLFFYAIGAIFSPFISAVLIDSFGPSAMFVFIALSHLGLLGFGFVRARIRPESDQTQPYAFIPRTSPIAGNAVRKARE